MIFSFYETLEYMLMSQVFNLDLDVEGILRKEETLLSLRICLSLSGFNIHALDAGFDLQNGRG